MVQIVQILTLIYCASFVVAAWQGKGPLHDIVVTVAIALAGLAITRQILINIFSVLEKRRHHHGVVDFNPPSTSHPTVSIIVPAYNEEAVIEKALLSMLKLNYYNYEIIIIDDGSTDNTLTIARRVAAANPSKLRVYTQKNSGKSAALNLGIRLSEAELVLCVDADSTLDRNGLLYAVGHFKDPDIAAVAGFVDVKQNGSLLTRLQRTEYLMSQRLIRAAIGYFACIPIVPGPAGMFRRRAIMEAGGYIDSSECFAEDAELTIRMLANGHKIIQEPYLRSETQAPADMFSLLRQRYRWSRGLIQALFLNAHNLIHGKSRSGPAVFIYLLTENLFLPMLCFGIALFFLVNTLVYGEITAFSVGLLTLVGLEFLGLLLVTDKHRNLLVLLLEYITIRFVYAYVLSAWTLLCLNDELQAISMSWDKLERYGMET